jgi:UDP-N-acetylglucosamine 2-epimerase (non-hydrolysing)
MSKVFFEDLDIPIPDYNLDVGSGGHGGQTGKMLIALEPVLEKEAPDFVIVYGDTNSTLAGAVAAAKLHIPLGHVEAGLRSHDKWMPEEINRMVADRVTDLLFCPTETAVRNLRREGFHKGIHLVGDVMLDAMKYYIPVADKRSEILSKLNLEAGGYLVATIHRQENTDDEKNLRNIVRSFRHIELPIILPLHPRTGKFLRKYHLTGKLPANVRTIPPLGYLDLLKLMKHAKKIITDSGGLQKEAYLLQIPCITLRTTTEWIETILEGWNVLVGTNEKQIVSMVRNFTPKKPQKHLFGDGRACKKISAIIKKTYGYG